MDIEHILAELTLEEKAGLCSGRDYWTTKAVPRLGVPGVFMCDGPHGLRKQTGEGGRAGISESIETVCYPSASALASSFDRGALARLGKALGEECQAENVGMLLGPGLNIKRSPLCGRNFEYFSEDPFLAGELGSAYVEALQAQGVAACVKHFAANNQETRRMSSTSEVDERTLHEIYLPAFERAVKKGGAHAVMCAYNALNGTACSENRTLLTDILRREWGFSGMVVTDWGAVRDRARGLLAGLDLEMPGGPGNQDADIVAAVKAGELDEAVLDEAVRHVLGFIGRCEEQRRPGAVIDRAKCADLSEKLGEECAVLLKNEGCLPLREDGVAAFIGEFAEAPRYQGAGSSHVRTSGVVGALEYARGQGLDVTFSSGCEVRDAVRRASAADAAVVFAGLPEAYESEGCDRASLALPDDQNALIEAVAAANPNTVVVLHGGAPMLLPWLPRVKAVLCMYLGGQRVGESAVRLLYGRADPGGRLAETWPAQLEDNPSFLNFPGEDGVVRYREGVYVGYRYYQKKKRGVLFPFGHGLSYTKFEYSGLTPEKTGITAGETLNVRCTVRNTGERAGSEALQLYVGAKSSTVGRPVRELKGFEKVFLAPGEEKTVAFSLPPRAFAYYEPKIHGWFTEGGDYAVEIGASCEDIRLRCSVAVTATAELPVHYTADSTVGELIKSEKGRAFIQNIMGRDGGIERSKQEHTKTLGEGSADMVQNTMMGMPLRSVVTFGRMTREQLDGLLTALNTQTEE